MNRVAVVVSVILGCLPFWAQALRADGPLERVQQRADQTATAAQDIRRGVDTVTDPEAAAETAVDAAQDGLEERAARRLEDSAPAGAARELEDGLEQLRGADEELERRATAGAEDTEVARRARELERELEGLGNADTAVEARVTTEFEDTQSIRAARELEADVEHAASADDRAQAAIAGEIAAAERELESSTDVDGRARAEVDQSGAAVAAREAQGGLEEAADAGERAGQEVRSTRDRLQRALRR